LAEADIRVGGFPVLAAFFAGTLAGVFFRAISLVSLSRTVVLIPQYT
jgi:hypothetical protein